MALNDTIPSIINCHRHRRSTASLCRICVIFLNEHPWGYRPKTDMRFALFTFNHRKMVLNVLLIDGPNVKAWEHWTKLYTSSEFVRVKILRHVQNVKQTWSVRRNMGWFMQYQTSFMYSTTSGLIIIIYWYHTIWHQCWWIITNLCLCFLWYP